MDSATVTVTNTGAVAGSDVVQVYGHDLVGSIVRPVVALLGYQRVTLDPGRSATVTFRVPTQRFAFHDRAMKRIVEPGDVEVWVGSHASASLVRASTADSTGGVIVNERAGSTREIPGAATPRAVVAITGDAHPVKVDDPRLVTAEVNAL